MSSLAFQSGCVDAISTVGHVFRMPKRPRTFIKEWRKHRGLSQEALAERTDMSNGNLSLIERGLQSYTQDTLERIAKALDCTPADLLSRRPEDADDILPIWLSAGPEQRQQIIDLVKVVLRATKG